MRNKVASQPPNSTSQPNGAPEDRLSKTYFVPQGRCGGYRPAPTTSRKSAGPAPSSSDDWGQTAQRSGVPLVRRRGGRPKPTRPDRCTRGSSSKARKPKRAPDLSSPACAPDSP